MLTYVKILARGGYMTIDEARTAKYKAEAEITAILEKLQKESGLFITAISGAKYIDQYGYMWSRGNYPDNRVKIEWDLSKPQF
jgi:hypothetical protein